MEAGERGEKGKRRKVKGEVYGQRREKSSSRNILVERMRIGRGWKSWWQGLRKRVVETLERVEKGEKREKKSGWWDWECREENRAEDKI